MLLMEMDENGLGYENGLRENVVDKSWSVQELHQGVIDHFNSLVTLRPTHQIQYHVG